jgi:hypothetical protein
MATETPSSSFDLPPNLDYAKDPETGRLYYIDHTTETTSWIHPRLKDELPPNFECRMDKASEKICFIDHANKTSSLSHLCHKDFHRHSDTEPELLYPYKQCVDAEGRHYYINDESKTTSWMHPTKLAELKATGILDEEIDEYRGDDGQAWKAWVLEDVAECGLNRGASYFVNYRTGSVDWQSPEQRRIAQQKALERRAAREAAAVTP